MIVILKQCKKDILTLPLEIREDLADVLVRLEEGHLLSLPLSRPLPQIGKGINELRLRDQNGIYRIIYKCKVNECVYVIHAFKKKTQKIPEKEINLIKNRLKGL
jgi:phage-related protein